MPLATRPPYATDEPESAYDNLPKPTPRPKKKQEDETYPGGARDSAYTTFDSYFNGNEPDHRASGVDDIGRGLMNADSDYDDSDDEQPKPKPIPQPADKHRALFEAATGISSSPPKQALQVRPELPSHLRPGQQQQPPASRENDWSPPPVNVGIPPGLLRGPGTPIQQSSQVPLAAPAPAHFRPAPAFMQGPASPTPFLGQMPGTPTPRTPQPLPPPQTPITPIFVRPKGGGVKFEDLKGDILRGNTEDTFLPRGKGGKTDDFWRRFSIVAHEEEKTGSKSTWLRKTQSGSMRLANWVWCVGIIILIIIGAAVGLGWYFTHNKPASRPVAIGGSAGEVQSEDTTVASPASTVSVRPTKVTAALLPTTTSSNERRSYIDEILPRAPMSTPLPLPNGHRRTLVNRISH